VLVFVQVRKHFCIIDIVVLHKFTNNIYNPTLTSQIYIYNPTLTSQIYIYNPTLTSPCTTDS